MMYGKSVSVYRELVVAKGHEMIKATHPTTFELTKDPHLTARGDCIIGVKLDKGVAELDPEIKEALKRDTSIVLIVLMVGEVFDTVLAQGSRALDLRDERRIIVRRSSYVDPATLAINANKSARNIKRDLVEKLRNPATELYMYIYVLDLREIVDIKLDSASQYSLSIRFKEQHQLGIGI